MIDFAHVVQVLGVFATPRVPYLQVRFLIQPPKSDQILNDFGVFLNQLT